MRLWSWYRERRWWWQAAMAVPAFLGVAAGLYLFARGAQYASAERDAGLFLPAGANVVLRLKGLSEQWERIRETPAWRTVQDRILGDRAFRRQLNGFLEDQGLPSLDELEDVRKGGRRSAAMALRFGGRDVLAAARVGETWKGVAWCAATRVGYLDFLLLPLADLFLSKDTAGGRTVLKVRAAGGDVFVAFEGSVVVASNQKDLLAEALKKRGNAPAGALPVEARIEFERSAALRGLRQELQKSGLLPLTKVETIAAASWAADLRGSAAFVDLTLEGAESTAAVAPAPHEAVRFAPALSSGALVVPAGIPDIHSWLRSLAEADPKGLLGKNARIGLETLADKGFEKDVLPKLQGGLAVFTAAQEYRGQVYPAVALLFPSKDSRATVTALTQMIAGIAGSQFENRIDPPVRIGEAELISWNWPDGFQLNEFLRTSYAAVGDLVLFSNNRDYAEAVLRVVSGEAEPLRDSAAHRPLSKKLKEYGLKPTPPVAGGFLFPPSIKLSFDALLPRLAKWQVEGRVTGAQMRAQVIAEMRQQGLTTGPDAEAEIGRRYHAAFGEMFEQRERAMRDGLRVLDRLRWMAWETAEGPRGLSIRLVVELDAPARR